MWLDHGYLLGDDTDGHLDTVARFCDPATICYLSCDDPANPHYSALKAMEMQLRTFSNTVNQPYQLIPITIPDPITDQNGAPLPASYMNFSIINNAVLAPIYNNPKDAAALEQLTKCFPQRKIIPIISTTLIQQFGAIHCASMQIPELLV